MSGRGVQDRRLAACVAASAALHAAALAFGPAGHFHDLEPPAILSVELRAPDPAPESVPARAAVPIPAPTPPAASPPQATPVRQPRSRPAPVRPDRLSAASAPGSLAAPEAPAEPAAAPAAPSAAERSSGETSGAASGAAAAASNVAAAAPPAPVATAPSFAAAYLRNPAPPYPVRARRNGEQGTVLLRVWVAADGAARRAEVERSSGHESLDAAALAAVKTWRFVPARRGDAAVEGVVIVPIAFRLESGG